MNLVMLSRSVFLWAGFYALLCAPAILLAEHFGWWESPLHVSQLFAVIICLSASLVFLWSTRGTRFDLTRWLSLAAVILSGLWLSFIGYVFFTFDLSSMG